MIEDTKKDKKPQAAKKASHHDIFFKQAYSDPCFARELFHLVFTKEEISVFDWNSLLPERDSFQDLRADLIFSVCLKGDPERRVRICLLLEHKSQYSPKVYYQVLKYETFIIGRSLEEAGEAWPVFCIVFYHGQKPWQGERTLKQGFWGRILSKIPSSLKRDMLDCGIRVLDTNSPEVERAIRDKGTKSRGFLNILKEAWSLKPELKGLEKAVSLFDSWTGDEDDLILSLGNYLWAVVPGMTEELWRELERAAVKQGVISKGGYMNIKEHIKEEGRQQGMQQGRLERDREVILNMLQNNLDMSLICKVTGLSEQEIKKLQQGS